MVVMWMTWSGVWCPRDLDTLDYGFVSKEKEMFWHKTDMPRSDQGRFVSRGHCIDCFRRDVMGEITR